MKEWGRQILVKIMFSKQQNLPVTKTPGEELELRKRTEKTNTFYPLIRRHIIVSITLITEKNFDHSNAC